MSKLVIIDGNAIMHRSFHAIPRLTNRAGEPTNAAYGFVSMLLKTITDLKPTHLVVCFDRKEKTFRHEDFEDYQSHRPETHEDLSSQFSKATDICKSMKIPTFSKAGFEADDLIGTISKEAKVDEVIIVTGDKDIFQLINKKVKVYVPIKGLSVAELMGEKEVFMKMGVTPKQIIDYKGLVGDSSDNYKGVPGVGPKTALTLLGDYKTFGGVYKNLDLIPERIANLLKKGKKSGQMSFKLAKIIVDVDIEFDLEKAAAWQVHNKKVSDLFSELSFRTLVKRAKNVGEQIEKEKQGELF